MERLRRWNRLPFSGGTVILRAGYFQLRTEPGALTERNPPSYADSETGILPVE